MSAALEPVGMSHEAWESYRAIYKSDPWEFGLDICGFDRLVERFHKPVIYLLTHQIDLLIDVLRGPLKSAVISRIKQALKKKGLDWTKERDRAAIHEFSLLLNIRIARKLGKTTCGQVAIAWDITVDPHHSWAIVSRDDDAAEEMCLGIGDIIRSDAYRFFFPERIPENAHVNITQSYILLAGRTRKVSQPCVTAGGVDSGWVSKHFDRIYGDDLVGRENKSPAKLKVVHEFQANKSGLKVPEWDEPFYDFTIGTRWATNDDAKVLDEDRNCLSIYVMIEERNAPVTLGNMLESHEPTLPEWFDREKIAKEKADYMRDKKLGPVALLANLFLTVLSDAAKIFDDGVVDTAKFFWGETEDGETDRRFVRRLENPRKPQSSKVLKFPVRALEIKVGVDPAESMTGDPWAVSVIGRDSRGTKYQIQTEKGHGPHGLKDAILYVIERFNPDVIGVEGGAMQGWVLTALETDHRFANHIHKFTKVPTNGESKRGRAKNLVAAPLEMGELLLSPDPQNPAPEDMKGWDPDNKNADDASIDSIGIAMTLFEAPASGYVDGEVEEMAKLDAARYKKSIDPDFGIPIESMEMDDDWFIDDPGVFDYDDEIAV